VVSPAHRTHQRGKPRPAIQHEDDETKKLLPDLSTSATQSASYSTNGTADDFAFNDGE